MVAKKIELRTTRGQRGEDSDGRFSMKDFGINGKQLDASKFWIIGIIILLGTYHCYTSYQEQVRNQGQEREEAMNCMYQFKAQDCNPMNLTDKCK